MSNQGSHMGKSHGITWWMVIMIVMVAPVVLTVLLSLLITYAAMFVAFIETMQGI